jgi:hypothetical protein
MRRRLGLLGVALIGLTAGACSSAHSSAAAPTTTVAPDPYAVPSVITPAYVDRVFVALNHINGDATRLLVTDRSVTRQVEADLRAIYNDPLYQQEVEVAQESLTVLANARPNPGDAVTKVIRVISASPTCIFISASTDLSAVVIDPGPKIASEYWTLSPKQQGNDPLNLNPTPWALSYNVVFISPHEEADQCRG